MSAGFKYWDVVLTDIDGLSAIVKNNGTSDNRGVYEINAATAGTYNFYIDYNGQLSAKIENVKIQKTTGGGTLKVVLQYKIRGSWVDGDINESYKTNQVLDYTDVQAAKWNIVKINNVFYGVPIRLSCTVSAAGIISAQVLRS